MPGKSRQAKGRAAHLSKKSRARQRHTTAAPPPVAAAPPPEAVASPPVPKAPAAPAKSKTMQYPYIAGELGRIAILAVIVAAILVVLSLVLS